MSADERRSHCLQDRTAFGYKAAGDCASWSWLSGKYGYRYFIVDKERDEEGKIISSTYIREMLADGNIRKANDLLGYCYFVTGKVEHGNAIGIQSCIRRRI